jgi:hypothetical protein
MQDASKPNLTWQVSLPAAPYQARDVCVQYLGGMIQMMFDGIALETQSFGSQVGFEIVASIFH